MTTPTGAALPASVLDLVRQHEGRRLTAYLCPAGVWTIGYGHTAGVKQGMRITETQAEEFLRADLAAAADAVDQLVTAPLAPHQLGALASFVFNVGRGAFAGSTMLKKLNAGDMAGAAAEFAKWNKATVNGKKTVLPGLVRRRADEAALFVGDEDTPMPQAVEPPPAMKPLARSTTVQAGAGGLTAAAVVTMVGEAREVSDAVRGALEGLPSGGLGWVAAAVLAAAVAFMLWRRVQDKRTSEAA